ncbi:MAG: glycosyltransferase [bacterium]
MSASPRLRILRIRRPANLITAQAFEDLFDRQFATIFDVSFAPLEAWCHDVLGAPGSPFDVHAAAARFSAAVARNDFFCPSYECIPLTPLLLAARNRAASPARLLFIAHAPGIYAFEWALLRPLLAIGDVIIAPTESARRMIDYLCPELAPFVRTMPHPMGRLTRTSGRSRPPRIASLGRIHAQKLTHRLIEAMAILRTRNTAGLQLEIGGPLDDGGWPGPHPYTLTLREKVRRLKLDDCVTFAGPVRGDTAKSAFLSSADVVVNLSVTIEESFGKTPVEALGIGVPVVGTDWVGLRDTIGPCGRLVPVAPSGDVVSVVDVDARHVADAIQAALDAPPLAERCIEWAEQFGPAVILPLYRTTLEAAAAAKGRTNTVPDWPDVDVSAAPTVGLLADAPPLSAFSWRDVFDINLASCDAVRRDWAGDIVLPSNEGTRVRGILMSAVEPSLKLFAANLPPYVTPRREARPRPRAAALDVLDRLEHASIGHGLVAGRAACLRELIAGGRLTAAEAALECAAHDGLHPGLVGFWRAELALARGDAAAALTLSAATARERDLGESDWPLIRQVARLARRAALPGAALPVVLAWLDRFPDSQESGPVWLDACVSSMRARESIDTAEQYCAHARALLGDMPAVQKCSAMVVRARQERMLSA